MHRKQNVIVKVSCVSLLLKFIYSEKATKFCEISTLLLSYVVAVKSKVEISQNFVAFSEYMNFTMAQICKQISSSYWFGTRFFTYWGRHRCRCHMGFDDDE